MRHAEHDPLPFGRWLAELGELADRCAVAAPGEEDRAVRRAFHLFQLAAPSIRALGDPRLEESVVEQALERDGPEAAIRLIAGARAAFAVAATGPDSDRIVVEISYDGGQRVRGAGASVAYAMIAAWAAYFTTVR